VIVSREDGAAAIKQLQLAGETAWIIGAIQPRTGDEAQTQVR
jgi:phosphoribosylaminoimidazole (AIR) synthetase